MYTHTHIHTHIIYTRVYIWTEVGGHDGDGPSQKDQPQADADRCDELAGRSIGHAVPIPHSCQRHQRKPEGFGNGVEIWILRVCNVHEGPTEEHADEEEQKEEMEIPKDK